jgi:hypothetical protein
VQDQTNVWQIDSFHIGTLIMLQVQSFEMKSFWQILNPIFNVSAVILLYF